jgi:hypothetical protein
MAMLPVRTWITR